MDKSRAKNPVGKTMHSTIRTKTAKPISNANLNACLVKIYPTDSEIGKRFALSNRPVLLGRDEDCDICIRDSSVSRKHVKIVPDANEFRVQDQKSTNGVYINDATVSDAQLKDGDYLRLGSSIFRFLSSGNVEADYHRVIYRLTIIDALTDVFNNRYLMDYLERELLRSGRHYRPLSLVLLDIDHFKSVNDSLGHLCGDYTLREMISRIKNVIRRDELLARYGGEEFVVVLTETTEQGAVQLAERLRHLVADNQFEYEGEKFYVTISLGVASTQGDNTMTSTKLLELADEKMYQAKREGRNRTVS